MDKKKAENYLPRVTEAKSPIHLTISDPEWYCTKSRYLIAPKKDRTIKSYFCEWTFSTVGN